MSVGFWRDSLHFWSGSLGIRHSQLREEVLPSNLAYSTIASDFERHDSESWRRCECCGAVAYPLSVWKVSVNNQKVSIRVETKPSTRRDHAVKLVYVQIDGYTYCFVTKIVNKGYRSRETNNFNATQGIVTDNGIAFLVNEISVRTQIDIPGLCKLMAVRDSENFTFLCLSTPQM